MYESFHNADFNMGGTGMSTHIANAYPETIYAKVSNEQFYAKYVKKSSSTDAYAGIKGAKAGVKHSSSQEREGVWRKIAPGFSELLLVLGWNFKISTQRSLKRKNLVQQVVCFWPFVLKVVSTSQPTSLEAKIQVLSSIGAATLLIKNMERVLLLTCMAIIIVNTFRVPLALIFDERHIILKL